MNIPLYPIWTPSGVFQIIQSMTYGEIVISTLLLLILVTLMISLIYRALRGY